MTKIDLCCGHSCKEGYEGLDIQKWNDKVKHVCDLNKGKLPFKDNSIDAFYEQNSFYELENPMQIIKECHRCLKKGGILEFEEMHFSSHYAYIPYTKNFWGFNTARLFGDGYRGDLGWEIKSIDFTCSGFTSRWLVNLNRNFYEKYLSRILPITSVKFLLIKR